MYKVAGVEHLRTIIYSEEAESVLENEIREHHEPELIIEQLEWILCRAPERGKDVTIPEQII